MRFLWWKRTQERVPEVATSLLHIRAHMAALGYDLSEFTDEEIVVGIERAGEAINAAKITMQQAADALAVANNAWTDIWRM